MSASAGQPTPAAGADEHGVAKRLGEASEASVIQAIVLRCRRNARQNQIVTGADVEPSFVPEHIRAWAAEHRDLLEMAANESVRTGSWPVLSEWTRALAAAGQPAPLRKIFWTMPKPLGWIEHNPERVRLTAYGLRFTLAGQPLLHGLWGVLRLAVERYPLSPGEAVVRRTDLASFVAEDLVPILREVLLSDAPFLGGFQGTDDDWVWTIDERIVSYWTVGSLDEYLSVRVDELREHPQMGWTIPRVEVAAPPADIDEADTADDAQLAVNAGTAQGIELGVARGQREWQIGEQIGDAGGMGAVYAAASGDLEAAIKLVPKDPGADRELLFADDLEGVPNVVPVWDKGEYLGYWFIVMPRAERSLKAQLDHQASVSTEDAVGILIDVADALVALAGSVVHRDLKPANILLLDGRWCLADFGIARYAEAATGTETKKGWQSHPYAAPERWKGVRATQAADIYSLGVIAYQLVAGELPFAAESLEELRDAHLHQAPPDLVGVPAALAALVGECLYKSPEARPSAANLRARLDRVIQPPGSTGLARLSEVNQREVQRLSGVASRDAAAMTAAERRQLLIGDASRAYARISESLFSSIMEIASAAKATRDPDVGNWRIALGQARLEMSPVQAPSASWDPAGLFDLVAVGAVSIRIPTDHSGYSGRSHALWFADAQVAGEYAWFETGFTLNAFIATLPDVDPFALDGDHDAQLALSRAAHTHQVSWPFTPLRLGELDDFVSRWAGWLAEAGAGRLQRVSGDGGQALGSWRQS